MNCKHCGAENENDAKFCVSCGKVISQEEQIDETPVSKTLSKSLKVFLIIAIVIIVFGTVIIGIDKLLNNNTPTYNNSNNGGIEIADFFEKKRNKQIISTVLSEDVSDYEQPTYFRYALTNENECLDIIYTFDSDYVDTDVESYIESKSYDILDDLYSYKYCYTYDNADYNDNIFIKEYAHFPYSNQREYDGWFRYIRDNNYNEKIVEVKKTDLEGNNCHEVTEYHHSSGYDENGRLSFSKILGYQDEVNSNTEFVYNEDGNLEHKYWTNSFGDYCDYSFTYETDSEGYIRRITKSENGSTKEMFDFEYDSEGNIFKSIKYTFDSNGEKKHKQTLEYQYDSNGNITQKNKEYYDSSNEEYEYTQTNYYYNDNQNLTKIIENKDNSTKYHYFLYTDSPTAYYPDNQYVNWF